MSNSTLGAEGSKKKTRLRDLVEEKFQELLAQQVEPKLTGIETFVKERVEEMNKRSKSIQGFIMGEVKTEIADKLHNASLTVDAIVAVLADAGINIPDFEKKVDEKKLQLNQQLKEKAAAEMQARIDKSIEEAKAKKAAEASAPAPETAQDPTPPSVQE